MRKLLAWLGVATLFVLTSSAQAQNDVLKPYVVLILDTSGSMLIQTGSGPTSCGKQDNRINHAVCAINNIVNSYGDMVFSLGRFREATSVNGTLLSCDANGDQNGNPGSGGFSTFPPTNGDQCMTQGAYCGDCDPSSGISRSCAANSACDSNSCTGIVAETVAQCANNVDDDGDGYINDGCAAFNTGESGTQCNNNLDDDGDGHFNDGCAARGTCATGNFACTTSDREFEVLTPLVDGNNTAAAEYTNGTCNTCGIDPAGTLEPEIWGVSPSTFTPLAATLAGSKLYWQGYQATDGTVIWQSNRAGYDPINRDPANEVFLPPGTATTCDPSATCVGSTCCLSQCRPYVNILLTDGDETCTTFTNTVARTTDLLATQPHNDFVTISSIQRVAGTPGIVTVDTSTAHPFVVGDAVVVAGSAIGSLNSAAGTYFTVATVPSATRITYLQTGGNAGPATGNIRHYSTDNRYRIETKPIGFGLTPGDANIEDIAHAGGAFDVIGVNEGYYANDESELELAISQILADSVRSESCNGRDDDCDTRIDEDFALKDASNNPLTCQATNPNGSIAVGICANTGFVQCNAAQTGTECSVQPKPSSTDGPNCNGLDDDCDGRIDEGLGCTPCTGSGETCNGLDDDCDGVADQTCRCNAASTNAGAKCDQIGTDCTGGGACVCTPITRQCANTVTGVGSCPGVQQCIGPNQFSACVGQTPTVETCDGVDNDCDGICDGFTDDCSVFVSPTGPGSDNPGDPAHVPAVHPEKNDACKNLVDDDGDGLVNDGCPAVGPAETSCADAVDSDGDGKVNDGCPAAATPLIAENICNAGVKTCPQLCAANQFGACSGEELPCNCPPNDAACLAACIDPCNGQDDDCDNAIDEDFASADCSNNCGVGTTVCIGGNISCSSAPTVGDPTCNNIDDDCDGKFDENYLCPNPVAGGAESNCTDAVDQDGDNLINDGCPAVGAAETGANCTNAVDNDGDGVINDGCPGLDCPCGAGSVCEGIEKCENGQVVCKGDPIGTEICNCEDDDCDGVIDNNNGNCPGGSTCANCQCAFACAAGEFPCPLGKKCEITPVIGGTAETMCTDAIDNDSDGTINDGCPFCVNDPCFQVTCPAVNGNLQTCIPKPSFPNEPQCVDACTLISCSPPNICYGPAGECRPNNCATFPDMCSTDQACINGVCVTNPCIGVTCDSDKYCVGGACVQSCSDVDCPTGQRCDKGACETDPCGHPCPFGQACNDTTGHCIEDPCKFRQCPVGQWCNPNDGACEDDPCVQSDVTCPNPGEVCRGGSCYDPDDLRPDAAGEAHVTVGGGGGCDTTGGGSTLLFVALALLGIRRKRSSPAVVRGGGVQ